MCTAFKVKIILMAIKSFKFVKLLFIQNYLYLHFSKQFPEKDAKFLMNYFIMFEAVKQNSDSSQCMENLSFMCSVLD